MFKCLVILIYVPIDRNLETPIVKKFRSFKDANRSDMKQYTSMTYYPLKLYSNLFKFVFIIDQWYTIRNSMYELTICPKTV